MITTEIFEILIVLCILEAQMIPLMLPGLTAVGEKSCPFIMNGTDLKMLKESCGFSEVYVATDLCTCTSKTSAASISVKKSFPVK